ncbi:MAG: RecQ family ATP-dependent DNA helicase [Desulfobulbaceae bacterium]|nr:RecQ family ATP-dependent DNA helicase [Desulfobulbaceae bacterium]
MSGQDFVENCLLLDLETNERDEIFHIGAVYRERTLERKGRFSLSAALSELDELADSAGYLLGHNLLGHDLPCLAALAPHLRLLQKPVVDTLYLSPLAFPENPYHRLVKNYKLIRDSLNNPVADARLAASVFNDQWQSFAALLKTEPDVPAFYRFCFAGGGHPSLRSEGLREVFAAIGAAEITQNEAFAIFQRQVRGKACSTAVTAHSQAYPADPQTRPALAYCLAWLRVAGYNSVLPPWVRHRFHDVVPILKQLRETPCANPSCAWCQTTHNPCRQLARLFGYPAFRATPATQNGSSLQEAIVGRGMRDKPQLAILPTGGGKSLCYQIPALVRNFRRGVLTVIISPLQALMKDQVDGLAAKTGTMFAAAIYGMLTPPERGEVLERVRLGDIAILYISPEQLRNKSVTDSISQREIGCWVFDEAHCLSKWGHDFRPDYLYASRFIREFAARQQTPIPPVACFTATAKRDVIEEITDHFRRELGQELEVFEGGVERSNLSFEVQLINSAERNERMHQILAGRLPKPELGSAIIYAATRNETENIRDFLSKKGWRVEAFHAGLEAPVKRRIQEEFLSGQIQVICATNAFGMGIDKDNVRLVIHANIPGSLENYLQEAGRAGRDSKDAECVLLYNENDIETQFRLEGLSELTRHDISQILRGLRRAKRNKDNQVVITSGELLRDEEVQTRFDSDDRMADTKVKTAVSWLERAGFIERNQNNTRVFQGLPLVRNLEEAERKIALLGISAGRKKRWLAILQALFNAKLNEAMSADELAELPEFREREKVTGPLAISGDTQLVLRDLHAMTEAGLLKQGMLLNAFVRYKVGDHSLLRFDKVCRLEMAMLQLMQETEPEAEGWLDLSLRRLNQRLADEGQESLPELLRNLLKSLALDGKGLAGNRGSIEFRYFGQDHYRLKLNRDWPALLATAEKRRLVARVILDAIFAKIPANTPASGELLVNFSMDDLALALRGHLFLAGQLKDSLAAIDRALMFLHEQQVIILQQGLAVFRQAMTIRIIPEASKRRYLKDDFSPLEQHYKERVFQVHVMNEYARLGLEKIRQALDLVLAYFSTDRSNFIQRFFPGRKNVIDRATSQNSFHRIVDNLANPVQIAIVTAAPQENMLVLAGPGSGKTRVVAHRCAFLLRVKRAPPRSILILCFNRNAANTLRRRLFELVGPDARGVTVLTYHGLAMRLTGSSFAERAEGRRMQNDDFKTVIPEAVRLLNGQVELTCLESDELRERLLAGYRYILVDEYQDIDSDQYQLISAIAGRTLSDPDSRLALLVVGDDDQNIYTFRGANVEFIRRFQQDYQAKIHYLVENYRSSAHIIAAANALIMHNHDRMKTDTAIRINQGREQLPPGGSWEELDPVAKGRVQIVRVTEAGHQAAALVEELLRLRQRNPALDWSDCAVLARTRDELAPIRALCDQRDIPVIWAIDRDKTPPLHRLREIRQFMAELKSRHDELLSATDLLEIVDNHPGKNVFNPWRELLKKFLDDWREESGNAQQSPSYITEHLYENLAEQKRDQTLGTGIFLSTVHAAKGMEFPHVFVPGGWGYAKNPKEVEEERRTCYVAMTRAKETLCLFDRQDMPNIHTGLLQGDFICNRQPLTPHAPDDRILRHRYALLGMEDLFLDYAGRLPAQNRIHQHLAALMPGDSLRAAANGNFIGLHDELGNLVARLSKAAGETWKNRLASIERITVLALVQRLREDSGEEYRPLCQVDQWEVPLAEITYRADGNASDSTFEVVNILKS